MSGNSILSKLAPLVIAFALINACGTNPVTGKTELQLVSESQEISIGQENYLPSQQSQGGVYVIDKELSRYVNAVGQKLAAVSDRPELPYEFVVLNNPVPNAWALPGGKIAVNRGLLLELNSEAELAAVLGHEIVHAAARHGAKSMERGMLLNAGIVGLGIATSGEDNAELIVGAAALGSQLISQKYGRDAELESDLYGMKYMAKAGYDPAAAIKLQETFVKLSAGRQSNWLEGLFASHPPSQERVDANKATARQLNVKGVRNEDIYQQRIAHLIKTKPAYDQLEQAKTAVKENNPQKAMALTDSALKIEPREALFYALKGDIHYYEKRFAEAEKSFTTAINYNPEFFLFYLERGLTHEKLTQNTLAKQDLQKSIALLPTAPAYHALGTIAEKENDLQAAKEYYGKAADSKSEAGQKSALAYTRLDLPANPSRYIAYQGGADRAGNVVIELKNRSLVPVKNLRLTVNLYAESGSRIFQKDFQMTQTIKPGAQVSLTTGVPASALGKAGKVQVNFTGAQIVE
ncbi:MAG: M48 family metalloprotease [Gammaproteobacteria bacterium]|nr:M48 family metalloprotease [Gammaproteobacteria bacterium]